MEATCAPPLGPQELRLYWCVERLDSLSRRARVDQLLRAALAPLVGVSAPSLLFGREAKGRPYLRHPQAPDFNLTDTSGGTLIAVSAAARIGVDVERTDRRPPVDKLAARWFDGEEAQALRGLSAEQARSAFLRLWTAKEASCKATGTGIFGYLSQWRFDVLSAHPQLQTAPIDAGENKRWQHLRLAPTDEHTAVVALRDAPSLLLTAYLLGV